MRILVTGGAGYLGTELVRLLMKDPEVHSIHVYDNLSRKNFNFFLGSEKLDPKVKFTDGDVLDSYTLKREVQNADLVVHLAAKVSTPFAEEQPHLFDQVNNWGSAELSYALENSECKAAIYLSSTSVYGATDNPADLHTIPNPKTFYGLSKWKGERHLLRLSGQKKIAIIRCSNVYGYSPSMRFDAVINRFVLHARHYKRISVNGSGEQGRAFVHVERVSKFIHQLIGSPRWETIYNLADRNLTINEIANAIHFHVPGLETLYVDQQLPLKQVRVAPDEGVLSLIGPPETTFSEDVHRFLLQLA